MDRYTCQLSLAGFGKKGQKKLQEAKVLIVGMGGLGCPASQYLAAAGVGTLGIVDFDVVSLKNLHRQILYCENDVGKSKVKVALKRLGKQNSNTKIISYPQKITSENVLSVVKKFDIVVDCTDNFETRYLLNDACVISKLPLVHGSIYQYEGQVSVFNIRNKNGLYSPNYRDIFPQEENVSVPNCEEAGVIPTIAGIIGSVQANEVIKFIIGSKDLLSSKLLIIDALTMQSKIVELPANTKVKISQIYNPKVPEITVTELRKLLQKGAVDLVDVRTRKEHEEFNIGGENIPLDTIVNQVSLLKLVKPIVFYCRSGVRSSEAAKFVMKNYPKAHVFSLVGGISEWKKTQI